MIFCSFFFNFIFCIESYDSDIYLYIDRNDSTEAIDMRAEKKSKN